MKTISDLKIEEQQKMSALMTDCRMFFAFSNEQFTANKTPLVEGDKYTSLFGAGDYLPKSQLEKYTSGSAEIEKWFKDAIKENGLREQYIRYELNNHEAYYTGEIDDTLRALGKDYTEQEVQAVFDLGE